MQKIAPYHFVYIGPREIRQYRHLYSERGRQLSRVHGATWEMITFDALGGDLNANPRATTVESDDPISEIRVAARTDVGALLYSTFELAKRIARYRRVVFQIRMADPRPLILLRAVLKFRAVRPIYLQEYEGDSAAEGLYLSENFPSFIGLSTRLSGNTVRAAADRTIALQSRHIRWADGLVVTSREHAGLWASRLGTMPPCAVCPSLPPRHFHGYCHRNRDRTRSTLGFTAKDIVLTHVGGVRVPWQRFERVCALVRDLSVRVPRVRLLAIVHRPELELARQSALVTGVQDRTTICHCQPEGLSAMLSASDWGVFMRDDHLMTRITGSAKMGEYLGSGLPVISTGHHANYQEFILREDCVLRFNPATELDDGWIVDFLARTESSRRTGARESRSARFVRDFYDSEDALDHVRIVASLASSVWGLSLNKAPLGGSGNQSRTDGGAELLR